MSDQPQCPRCTSFDVTDVNVAEESKPVKFYCRSCGHGWPNPDLRS